MQQGDLAKKERKTENFPNLGEIWKNDAVKVLHSICQQIWKTQQWPQDWKSQFSSNPKESQCQRMLKKLISNPKISIQNNLLQDAQSKLSKSKDKERILSLKRRKKLSPKRTPIRRSAYLSKETLQTMKKDWKHTPLSLSGKQLPGRDRRGHERKCSLQSHSRSWEGKGPSQAPSTSGNESQGPGQGLGNLYT